MSKRTSFAAPMAVLSLFTTLLLYVGAYVALVEPRTRLAMQPDGCCRPVRKPAYRAGGQVSAIVFSPICKVDHLVRPRYWQAD